MISSLSNYCSESDCDNYRWPGCDDDLCPLHCLIEEQKKKLKRINELIKKLEGVQYYDEEYWPIREEIEELSDIE